MADAEGPETLHDGPLVDFEHAGRGDAPQGALGVQFDGGDHLALFLAPKEGLGNTNSEDAESEEITEKFETPLGASINKDVFVLILNFLHPKERLLYRLNREFQSPRSILRRDLYTLHRDRLRFLGYELRVCTAIGCTRWRSPWSLSHACLGCASLGAALAGCSREEWNSLRVRPPRLPQRR